MILIGTHVNQASTTAFFVILEKKLKNVRHYYTVIAAHQGPAKTFPEQIITYYNDKTYTIRKRIYSQDRRPKKDVSARPTVVMAAGQKDLPLIDTLRTEDVPIEAVFLEQNPGREPERAGIGKNYAATEQMIYETLRGVHGQGRLAPFTDPAPGNPLFEQLEQMLVTPDQKAPLLLAAAVPIWFRENVKHRSAYRTSSTSIRNYR